MRWFVLAIVACLFGCNGLSLKRADGAPTREAIKSALRLHAPSDLTAKYLAARGIETGWSFSPDEALAKLRDEQTPEARIVRAEMADLAGREAEVWSSQKAVDRYYTAAYEASLALAEPADRLDMARRAEALKIYNHAVARFLRRSGGSKFHPDTGWEQTLAKNGLRV